MQDDELAEPAPGVRGGRRRPSVERAVTLTRVRNARRRAAVNIELPLVGPMRVAGLTESELRDHIADALKRGIMRNPQVSVFVAEHVSAQVSVTGAVTRPGLYGLSRDRRTVSDLISEAGGLDEHAGGNVLFSACTTSGPA